MPRFSHSHPHETEGGADSHPASADELAPVGSLPSVSPLLQDGAMSYLDKIIILHVFAVILLMLGFVGAIYALLGLCGLLTEWKDEEE